MTEDEEIKRKVNSTPTKTNGSRPDPKISIGRVQNKLGVDSPRDETKGPFLPGMADISAPLSRPAPIPECRVVHLYQFLRYSG